MTKDKKPDGSGRAALPQDWVLLESSVQAEVSMVVPESAGTTSERLRWQAEYADRPWPVSFRIKVIPK